MTPTAILPTATATSFESVNGNTSMSNVTSTSGQALVIGSLSTAQDGQYQAAISAAGGVSSVEKQMLDRILDQATTLKPTHYSTITVVLVPQEYEELLSRVPQLLQQLVPSLISGGTLKIQNLSPSAYSSIKSDITLSGLSVSPSSSEESRTIISQKPEYAAGTSFSLKKKPVAEPSVDGEPNSTSVSLPKRLPSSNKSSKKQLWTLSSLSTPTIDPNSLLTSSDLARPVPVCAPPNADAPRRKKACKGCTCGLAELELAELNAGKTKVVILDGTESGGTQEVSLSEKEKLINAVQTATKVTSSCGSCHLGDAFRCESCPYLGLPAFEPGQKVEIGLDMDDI